MKSASGEQTGEDGLHGRGNGADKRWRSAASCLKVEEDAADEAEDEGVEEDPPPVVVVRSNRSDAQLANHASQKDCRREANE